MAAVLGAVAIVGCGAPAVVGKVGDLVAHGPSRELRKRAKDAPRSSPARPPILLLAFDGVGRDLLYEMLRAGRLPGLAELLGGSNDAGFSHAHFDDRMLSTLPSSTMAAWTTAMTGRPPADHGVSGNEFFMRESLRLAVPAAVSFNDSKGTLSIYTDAYLDALKFGPSVYDRMREKDPDVLVWVAMHNVYSGADRLLVTKPTILAQAFEHIIEKAVGAKDDKKAKRDAYAILDEELLENVGDAIEKNDGPLPDVLTIYLSGTDLYAHVADEGPDEARRAYLAEVVDPALKKFSRRVRGSGLFDDRYVVLTADHGHTEVMHDEAHARPSEGPSSPTALMKKAGYRVRPLKVEVSEDELFDAVWVAGGAMAYVYAADRSACTKTRCDWSRPPRWEDDVLPLADAFFRADADGTLVPQLRGTLDFVLTRRPKPQAEVDLPFEVYVGNGKTETIEGFLAAHPHPTYIDMAARLRDLAVGVRGERAGDVLLIAHNGDRDAPDQRFYFADLYRSWHGSPSRRDSEVPFIVAHPKHSSAELAKRVEPYLVSAPYQQKVTNVLLDLRFGVR